MLPAGAITGMTTQCAWLPLSPISRVTHNNTLRLQNNPGEIVERCFIFQSNHRDQCTVSTRITTRLRLRFRKRRENGDGQLDGLLEHVRQRREDTRRRREEADIVRRLLTAVHTAHHWCVFRRVLLRLRRVPPRSGLDRIGEIRALRRRCLHRAAFIRRIGLPV